MELKTKNNHNGILFMANDYKMNLDINLKII